MRLIVIIAMPSTKKYTNSGFEKLNSLWYVLAYRFHNTNAKYTLALLNYLLGPQRTPGFPRIDEQCDSRDGTQPPVPLLEIRNHQPCQSKDTVTCILATLKQLVKHDSSTISKAVIWWGWLRYLNY